MSTNQSRIWRRRIAAALMFLPLGVLAGCNVQQATEVSLNPTSADSVRSPVNLPDKPNEERCFWVNGEWICY